MVEIQQKETHIEEGKANTIVIKNISIDNDKNSITFTYRKDKDGAISVSGFDVKVYGDSANIIKSRADQLIKVGLDRMQSPYIKDEV